MKLPSFAIIIPARYASTRYPGKPLVPLRGATGQFKSLIQRSWECAAALPECSGVWVATDDRRIEEEVRRFGGEVIITAVECANGTERCADAIERMGDVADVIVNLQGDAPLSPSSLAKELVQALINDPEAAMATPAVRCSRTTYDHLAVDAAAGRVGGTTVVFNTNDRALYFSKRLIPYLPDRLEHGDDIPAYLHLGMYAYRPEALRKYNAAVATPLESLEGLEQLRFLELGLPVTVHRVERLGWDSIELNNPSDVEAIERVLAERGIE